MVNSKFYSHSSEIQLTLLEKPKHTDILTKIASIDANGELRKDGSQCKLYDGIARRITLPNLAHLGDFISGLKQHQAIALGVYDVEETRVVAEKTLEDNPDARARTKNSVEWPEHGLALFEHDPDKRGTKIPSIDQFCEILAEVDPQWKTVGYVRSYSTSACLMHEGRELTGRDGMHVYVEVANPHLLSQYVERLVGRLWLASYGYVKISRSGSLLLRTVFDTTVFSSERLIFEAGAICRDGITQDRPDPDYRTGHPLNLEALPALSENERNKVKQLQEEAKRAAKSEADKIRKDYDEDETTRLHSKYQISKKDARKIIESRCSGILLGDDVVSEDKEGNPITVNDLLAEPQEYDGETFPDPLEPEYDGGADKAIFYSNFEDDGTGSVHSFAHGPHNLQLQMTYDYVEKLAKDLPKDTVQERFPYWAHHLLPNPIRKEQLVSIISKILKVTKTAIKQTWPAPIQPQVDPQFKTDYDTQPDWIDTLNSQYGVVIVGSKCMVVTERHDTTMKYYSPQFIAPKELVAFHDKDRIDVNGKSTNVFTWWMKHEDRRTYEGITHRPDPEVVREGPRPLPDTKIYNCWQGYSYRPVQGNADPILQHIKDVWCSGHNDQYEYTLDWITDLFQNPGQPARSSLILASAEGTGKNIIVDNCLVAPFGVHGMIVTKPEHLDGRFNAHLGLNVLLFANEAVWGGNKKGEGTLKALITDTTRVVEKKFQDAFMAPNYTHLILASNSDWAAPVGLGGRRFVVLDVSDHRVGDQAYFQDLLYAIQNGGREAFLYEMLNRDIKHFDAARIPKDTSGRKRVSIIRTEKPEIRWFLALVDEPIFLRHETPVMREEWCNGEPIYTAPHQRTPGTAPPVPETVYRWPESPEDGYLWVNKRYLYEDYLAYCKSRHVPGYDILDQAVWSRNLSHKLGKNIWGSGDAGKVPAHIDHTRPRAIRLAGLTATRQRIAELVGDTDEQEPAEVIDLVTSRDGCKL